MNVELSLDELYTNLSLISKIEVGDKLVLKNNYITIDKSYLGFFSRWINNVGRDETLKYIANLLNFSFTYLTDESEKSRILNYLQLSLNGLNNLKQTYFNDKLVQAKIDVIIENINKHKFA
jgi:hypothetical protein